MVAAELVERFGDLALLRRHQVPPDAPVVELDLRHERSVGVDRVAGMDEHIGAGSAHGLVETHPAHRGIDPPSLTDRVRRPCDGHVPQRARSTAE